VRCGPYHFENKTNGVVNSDLMENLGNAEAETPLEDEGPEGETEEEREERIASERRAAHIQKLQVCVF